MIFACKKAEPIGTIKIRLITSMTKVLMILKLRR
jgi:hypothetical protein